MSGDPADHGDRIEHTEAVELRADGRRLFGYAIRYGALRRDGREKFAAGAFVETRGAPLVFQHDHGSVIAEAPRVELRADGLYLDHELPEGAAAAVLVERGALTGLSVGFVAVAEHREGDVRVIDRARLDNIGLVDRPAYPTSGVEVRADPAAADLRYWWQV